MNQSEAETAKKDRERDTGIRYIILEHYSGLNYWVVPLDDYNKNSMQDNYKEWHPVSKAS